MKSIILIFVTSLFVLILTGFKLSSEKKEGTIGDIKYSLLSPSEFIKVNGIEWVLLKGQSLDGSDPEINKPALLKKYINVLPDARGLFLRGVNENRKNTKEMGNSENKAVGEFQFDAIRQHSHNLPHKVGTPFKDNLIDGATQPFCVSKSHSWENDASLPTTGVMGLSPDFVSALETRPRNISAYIYVKIN